MPYLAGLLGGFRQAGDEAAERKAKDEQAMREREGKIFEALIASPNKDVRSYAVAGLLESATPSKRPSGIRRWLGEAQANPNLAYIQRLLEGAGQPQQAPSGASAAQAEGGATEPGATGINQGMLQPPTRTGRVDPFDPAVMAQQAATAAGLQTEEQTMGRGRGIERTMLRMRASPDTLATFQASQGYNPAGAPPIHEGPSIPDPQSPTGYSQILYGAQGEEINRLPAPAPPESYVQGDLVRDAKSPTGWSRLLYDPKDPQKQQRIVAEAPAPTREPTDPTAALLTPTEAASLGVPYGTTRAGAAAQGIQPMTPDQRLRSTAITQLVPMVKRLKELIAAAFPATGAGIPGRVGAAGTLGLQRLQGTAEYRELEGLLNVIKGPIAKTIAAESGRLTQQDIERSSRMVPNIGMWPDSRETSDRLIEQVQSTIDDSLIQMGRDPIDWGAQGAAGTPSDPMGIR